MAHLGATLNQLEQAGELPRLKALYLVSYQQSCGHHHQRGEKGGRFKLLRRYEKAAGHPIYLIEDAAYRELRFAGEDTPSALSMDRRANRVVYTSTFSKPFAARRGLWPVARAAANGGVAGTNAISARNFLQQILSKALTNGSYKTQVAKRDVTRKAKVMTQACQPIFRTPCSGNPTGGLYVWARLPAKGQRLKSALFEAPYATRFSMCPAACAIA